MSGNDIRKRHGRISRPSHTRVGQPFEATDVLYSSEVDIEGVTVVDLLTGDQTPGYVDPCNGVPEFGMGSGPPVAATSASCADPTPSGSYPPNNSATTPAGGHSFYTRAGLGSPPEVGPWPGAWHFPTYGNAGSPDLAGTNVGNGLHICVRGSGRLTIRTVGAGTINWNAGTSYGSAVQTGSVAAGTPLVRDFDDFGGTQCVHWVSMGMSAGVQNGYAGMDWVLNTVATHDSVACHTYLDTDTGNLWVYDEVNGIWVYSGATIEMDPLTIAELPAIALDYLSDVNTSTVAPTNGQSLVWDGVASLWKPGTVVPPSGLDSILTTTGDMVYRPGAANYATAAQGASVSAGGNVGSLANILDGNDATYFGTYNFQTASAVVDLGQVRAIGGFRAKLLGGSSTGVTVFSGTSATGPWTSQKVQTKDGAGVAQGSLPATVSQRWWKFDVNGHDGYEVDWYTIELLAGAAPARLPIGAAGTVLTSLGGVPAWSPPSGGTGGAEYFHHTQATADTTWTVNHMLGRHPVVSVLDSAGSQVEVSVLHVTLDQLVLTLSYAVSGTADCS